MKFSQVLTLALITGFFSIQAQAKICLTFAHNDYFGRQIIIKCNDGIKDQRSISWGNFDQKLDIAVKEVGQNNNLVLKNKFFKYNNLAVFSDEIDKNLCLSISSNKTKQTKIQCSDKTTFAFPTSNYSKIIRANDLTLLSANLLYLDFVVVSEFAEEGWISVLKH